MRCLALEPAGRHCPYAADFLDLGLCRRCRRRLKRHPLTLIDGRTLEPQ